MSTQDFKAKQPHPLVSALSGKKPPDARDRKKQTEELKATICSSLRTGIRLCCVWTLQETAPDPGTYTSCCRQLGSTPPSQSYSCCPHSPQTRREHSGPSLARSTSAPACRHTGRTRLQPNTQLRHVHTGKVN